MLSPILIYSEDRGNFVLASFCQIHIMSSIEGWLYCLESDVIVEYIAVYLRLLQIIFTF